jgi:hypothetical protein
LLVDQEIHPERLRRLVFIAFEQACAPQKFESRFSKVQKLDFLAGQGSLNPDPNTDPAIDYGSRVKRNRATAIIFCVAIKKV